MTESTGMKGETRCHGGFIATIKQQGVSSFWGILPQAPAGSGNDRRSLRILPSAP